MAKARLMSRLVYINEYDYLIAQIRNGSLPRLEEKIHIGWRVTHTSQKRVEGFLRDIRLRCRAQLWMWIEK